MSKVDASAEPATVRSFDLRLVLAVWLSLYVYGVLAAPTPAVNEPHYLCKSKHFWQPEWCARDFFLASPNAHTVFYVTVGWLTRWLSLVQTAWIARAAATLVLAIGWTSLTTRLLSTRWSPLLACWLFLAFESCGNLSGEWLVGGVEGKVFCYGLLFASCGQVLQGRIVLAGALAGLALSFHPVVGAWGVLAYAGASLVQRDMRNAERKTIEQLPSVFCTLLAPRSVLAFLLLVVLALPGLIPVLFLLLESAPAATKYSATYIQVYSIRCYSHCARMPDLSRCWCCGCFSRAVRAGRRGDDCSAESSVGRCCLRLRDCSSVGGLARPTGCRTLPNECTC